MHEHPNPPPLGRGPAPWRPLPAAHGERLVRLGLRVCAALPVLLSAALLVLLVGGAWSWGEGLAVPAEGLLPRVMGTLVVAGLATALAVPVGLLLCIAIAVPLGVGVALHLEGPRRVGRSLLALNIASLAAVPSVLWGLLGIELFVRALSVGHGMVAAALTLVLVVLPIVAVSARVALRSVPDELRDAGYALGGTPWQVTRRVVLPMALPGIASGAILAIARAFGEAAALLLVAGLTLPTRPAALGDPQQVLPLHVLSLLVDDRAPHRADAVVGVLVLLLTLVVLSAWAVQLRHRYERRRDGSRAEP